MLEPEISHPCFGRCFLLIRLIKCPHERDLFAYNLSFNIRYTHSPYTTHRFILTCVLSALMIYLDRLTRNYIDLWTGKNITGFCRYLERVKQVWGVSYHGRLFNLNWFLYGINLYEKIGARKLAIRYEAMRRDQWDDWLIGLLWKAIASGTIDLLSLWWEGSEPVGAFLIEIFTTFIASNPPRLTIGSVKAKGHDSSVE